MPIYVGSFEQALVASTDAKRHLLIGNGFSIALFPDRFRYGALLDEADFSGSPEARAAFDLLGTTDFEVVIRALREMVLLIPLYSNDNALRSRMQTHADALKELLVQAIAGTHPERPSEVTDAQYAACRRFLGNFIAEARDLRRGGGKNLCGQVYSLNYDLLLYWAVLHDQRVRFDPTAPGGVIVERAEPLVHDDGFRAPDSEPDAPYVTWDAEGQASEGQNIHFLHGAMHLFDDGPELQKRCWERSGGVPLVDQIRQALAENKFPLFVSEGNTRGKLDRIRHSGYLQRSLKSFAAVCRSTDASLFIFGHSLAENDDHILQKIARGKIKTVYVSLFGDPESELNRTIIRRAQNLAGHRSERYPLDVRFFSAQSANVWE